MTESGDTSDRGANDDSSRPLFDPARERAIERERARERQESEGRERSGRETDAATATAAAVQATGESSDPTARSGSQRSAETESDRPALGSGRPTVESGSRLRFASASDVTGRGVSLTLFGALLCALGYYGVLGLQAEGVQAFGSVVPAPFYALTFSVLFVFSLVPRAHRGPGALAWSVVFSVVFGTLLAVGTEGMFYLADNPDVATAGYTGLTVLALAVVVASITYWGVLSVAKTA